MIHNAGVISGPSVLPVNVVAPYLLTALLRTPTRNVYLSSGMHRGGKPSDELDWNVELETASYSTSKLFVAALSAEVADRWAPDVLANAADPGWVATRSGCAGAPDDFDLGRETQECLATDPALQITSGYWHHGRQQQPGPPVSDPTFRERIHAALGEATGVNLPDCGPAWSAPLRRRRWRRPRWWHRCRGSARR